MQRTARFIPLLVLAGSILSGCLASSETGALVGQQAPAFSLVDLEGRAVGTNEARGHVTLIDFMGANCSTCHLAMRALVPLQQTYGPQGVLFYSIDVGATNPSLGARNEDETRAFRDRYDANWSFALDNLKEQTAVRYVVIGLPTTVLLDRDGIIAYKEIELPTEEALAPRLERMLAGEAP